MFALRIALFDGLCFDAFGEAMKYCGVAGTRPRIPNASGESTMIQLFSGHIDESETYAPEAKAPESTVTERAVVLVMLMFD